MALELKMAYDKPKEVAELFKEYTDMLIQNDSSIAEYLKIQKYKEELENLEYKYGLPKGRLYLAYFNDQLAGCIGFRQLNEQNCEMKRLYVRPDFRGHQIGSYLVEQIINDAKEMGYKHILLDSLPFLKSAIKMYKSYGFYEIERYNDSPMATTIYMKLDLE